MFAASYGLLASVDFTSSAEGFYFVSMSIAAAVFSCLTFGSGFWGTWLLELEEVYLISVFLSSFFVGVKSFAFSFFSDARAMVLLTYLFSFTLPFSALVSFLDTS